MEHQDADRGNLDQGFEIRARATLVAVGACVGGRGLGVACTAGTEIFVVAAIHPDKITEVLGTGLEAFSSKA